MNEIEITFDNYISFDSYEEMTEYLSREIARKAREVWNVSDSGPQCKIEMRPIDYGVEPVFLDKSLGKYQMMKYKNKFLLNHKPPMDH